MRIHLSRRLALAAVALSAPGLVLAGVAAHAVAGHPDASQRRADQTVKVQNFSFMAMNVSVSPGQKVTWDFLDSATHTATSTQGIFDSGDKDSSSPPYPHTFGSSGSYPYFCDIHSYMTGTVSVPVMASGSPSKGWKVVWAAAKHPGTVDVQLRSPGSSAWKTYKHATTATGVTFNPKKAGTYAMRARTHEHGGTSSWSPTRTLKIT